MIRVRLPPLFYAWIGLAVCTQAIHAEDQIRPDYYPLAVGTKWHYRVDGQSARLTNHVAGIERIGGQPVSRVETRFMGRVIPTEHLANTPEGLYRYRSQGIAITPPLRLLRYPVKEGDTWEDTITSSGQRVQVNCRVGSEQVTVPAGSYQTVTIDVAMKVGGTTIATSRYWLAAGIGMVKQVNQQGGTTSAIELERFEPAAGAAP
jgi:hypothetical protein